jgi:flavin reductase (DIM6/NTAB) family NADH-FMN oxidoreductase RutF
MVCENPGMPSRHLIDPATARGVYPILGSLVAPRPIGWVSTRSAEGVDNLAPHSFYMLVSTAPPIVMISSMGEKDTIRNARATGEFVVAGTPSSLRLAVNETAVEFPANVSEFDEAGVTREASDRVAPYRVAESPYALECRVVDIIEMGNGIMLFGEVVLIAIDESVMRDGRVHAADLGLVARHGGVEWSTVGEVFDLPRMTLDEFEERRTATSPLPPSNIP